jgi:transcriptional regulator with XRE-family HTH domain
LPLRRAISTLKKEIIMSPEDEEETTAEDERRPGERLGELLEELRYTQTEVGEKCGVSPQYVNNIVRGRQRLTEDFAQALAAAVDVNLNWLYAGRGPMLREEAMKTEPAGEVLVTDLLSAADSLQHAADRLGRKRREQLKKHS